MLPQYIVLLSSALGLHVNPAPESETVFANAARAWAEKNQDSALSRALLGLSHIPDQDEDEEGDEGVPDLTLPRSVGCTADVNKVTRITYKYSTRVLRGMDIVHAIESSNTISEAIHMLESYMSSNNDPVQCGENIGEDVVSEDQDEDSEPSTFGFHNGLNIQAIRDFIQQHRPDDYAELTQD